MLYGPVLNGPVFFIVPCYRVLVDYYPMSIFICNMFAMATAFHIICQVVKKYKNFISQGKKGSQKVCEKEKKEKTQTKRPLVEAELHLLLTKLGGWEKNRLTQSFVY